MAMVKPIPFRDNCYSIDHNARGDGATLHGSEPTAPQLVRDGVASTGVKRETFMMYQIQPGQAWLKLLTSPPVSLLFVVEMTVRSFQPFLDVISSCNHWVFRRPIL